MLKSEVLLVGYAIRKFSFKGEILIRIKHSDLEPFLDLDLLSVDIDNTLVPYQIEKIKTHSKNQIRVKFLGIDNEIDAQKLLHKQIFASKKSIDFPIDTSKDINRLIGYRVDDDTIAIGTIKNIIDRPIQPLLVVVDSDNEFLIPFNRELILQEDQKNQKLIMRLPKGLINLNN